MSDQTITLTRIYNPLDHTDKDHIQWAYKPGSTVADLLDHTGAIISQRESVKCAVSVNGVQVPAEQYAETRLIPGQQVVVVPYLHGGGGGGKDILRMVGMVIITIIASIVSYGVVGGMVLGGYLSSSIAVYATYGIVFAGIMIGGSMLLNAAIGQASVNSPALNGYQGSDQSNTYSWNPQTTQQQGIAIPWRYGITKITGNIIGVYRENIGTQQYINVLISLGEGPISPPYDFKLNGQPIENYTGITLYTRLGYLDQDSIPNFGDTVTEYPQGTKINYGTSITYTTIGSSFDTLAVQVGCPNGLYRYDDYGNLQSLSINFSIEISPHGLNTWTHIATSVGSVSVSDGGYWSSGYWSSYTDYENGAASTWYWAEFVNGGTDPNSYYDGQSAGYGRTWRWIGDPILIVDVVNRYATISGAQTGQVLYTARVNDLAEGKYDVRITRLTTDYTDTRYGDEFYLMAVQEIILDDFTYPGEALVGLRALATDQLSGSFSFECKSAGKTCRVYDGTNWTVTATNNPAWVCFDILTQPIFDNSLNVVGYRAYDPAGIDLTRWHEWADYCDDLVPDSEGGTEPRLTYNGAFDSGSSMWDAALSVARIGRAVPFWRGQTITVAVDMPSDPVALISVGNIGLDSFEETFLPLEDRAGSIEADFLNIDKELDRDKFTVINPAAPASWGSASLQLQGVIKPSEVWRHCRYYLATTQNLLRVVTVQMDVDSIAFTLGDVINVQHDVPMWGFGGRIVAATSSTVTLDQEVTLTAGTTYSIMVRLLDNTLVERVISDPAGTYTTLTVTTPFSTLPSQYDPYAFGPVDTLVKPMRVNGIDPAGDLKRKITLTDYNETVWNTDLLQPVLPTVNYSLLGLKPVTDMALSERLVKRMDGVIDDFIVVTFAPPADDVTWAKAHIWYSNNNVWQYGGESTTGAETLLPCQPLETYRVKIVSLNNLALPLPENMCPIQSISTLGKTAPPADVTGLQAELTRGQMRIHWNANADVDLAGYEIQIGTVWDDPANKVLVQGYAGTSYAWTPDRTGVISILAKAIDTSSNYSTAETRLDYTISGPGIVATLTQQVIDNIVELKWSAASAGSFPIDYYELWKGNDFATSELLGRKYSTFDLLQESVAGTYKYWIRAVDVAGLAGTETGVYAAVNQPPDYVLIDTQNLVFSECTLVNALVENDQVVLPVNTTITFEDHFINNPDTTLEPWASPQDQVDDGYPLYGQPGPASASIERIIDYGALIPSSKLTMSVTRIQLVGNVVFTPEIFVGVGVTSDRDDIKSDSSIVTCDSDIIWVSLGNTYEAAAKNFRFIKYRLVITTDDGGIATIQQINTKLDVKRKTLVTNTINVSDTTGDGTEVSFSSLGIDPIDVVGIVAEAPYTGNATNDPIKALINFTDVANPVGFKVIAWNKSGVRVAVNDVTATITYI